MNQIYLNQINLIHYKDLMNNLNYLKKGMVSIYISYVWKKKPIIVKGSLDRIRDLTFINDTIKVFAGYTDEDNNHYVDSLEVIVVDNE